MSGGDRRPCPKCGALNYAADDICVSCGYDFPARAREWGPDKAAAGPPPAQPPAVRRDSARRLGLAAVVCSLLPVLLWRLESGGIALCAVAWLAGLILGGLAMARGERGLGAVALGVCLAELVLAIGLIVLVGVALSRL